MCQTKKEIKYQIAYMSFDIFFNLLVKTLSCNLLLDDQVKTSHSWCSFQKRSFHQTWSLLLITIFDHFEFLILFHCYSSSLISLVFFLWSLPIKRIPFVLYPTHRYSSTHLLLCSSLASSFCRLLSIHSPAETMVTLADDQLWGACDYDRLP